VAQKGNEKQKSKNLNRRVSNKLPTLRFKFDTETPPALKLALPRKIFRLNEINLETYTEPITFIKTGTFWQ
jgi:hypothetical protein